jgi:hypothetical protein
LASASLALDLLDDTQRHRYLVGVEKLPRIGAGAAPLYVTVCAVSHHVTLLTPAALLKLGLSQAAKVLDLKGRLRCRGCGKKGASSNPPVLTST